MLIDVTMALRQLEVLKRFISEKRARRGVVVTEVWDDQLEIVTMRQQVDVAL